jgi:hypothetical protein
MERPRAGHGGADKRALQYQRRVKLDRSRLPKHFRTESNIRRELARTVRLRRSAHNPDTSEGRRIQSAAPVLLLGLGYSTTGKSDCGCPEPHLRDLYAGEGGECGR